MQVRDYGHSSSRVTGIGSMRVLLLDVQCGIDNIVICRNGAGGREQCHLRDICRRIEVFQHGHWPKEGVGLCCASRNERGIQGAVLNDNKRDALSSTNMKYLLFVFVSFRSTCKHWGMPCTQIGNVNFQFSLV